MDVTFDAQISHKSDGLTLYQYLDGYFPFMLNRDWLARLVPEQTVLDDVVISGNPVLSQGQILSFAINNYAEDDVDTQWLLLWQNDDLLAVHKPANLPVHRTTRNIYNTLTALVRRESQWPEAQLMHRLDQETAGIVLFAKNKTKALQWQPKFHSLLRKKIYQAVVYGKPDWQSIELTNQLAVRKDSLIRCQMHVCDENEPGKTSTTRFKVLSTVGDYSVIECDLVTGRKHQIRAHLAHLGHPIVGDKIYAHGGEFYLKRLNDSVTDADYKKLITSHHLLIAHQLELDVQLADGCGVEIIDDHFPKEWINFLDSHQE